MQSKFFAGGSDTESNESEDNQSQTSDQEEKVIKKPAYFESSSDEDVKRVVRSEKDKRYDALRQIIARIKDKMRIKDFMALTDEFDELNKQLDKSKKVIEKEGVPLFYIRICFVLEEFLNNISAEDKKNLKPANAKAYNTLKHKVKKNNKNYEQKIKEFSAVISFFPYINFLESHFLR
jgi:translation initiation factor 3 subunit C